MSLLPSSATPQERTLVAASSGRLESIPVPIGDLWNPWTCPAPHLPWLAWALSVDDWDADWPEATKRAAIAVSYIVHRYKGTPGAIRAALQAVGYRDVQIIEGVQPATHDGSVQRRGRELYATAGHWALFRVVCDLGNEMGVDASTAANVVRTVNTAKNARSHLYAVGYRVTLTDVRPGDGADAIGLHVGLALTARCRGLRDGSVVRSDAARWLHDGTLNYDGADRHGHDAGPYFGAPRFAAPLRMRFALSSGRAANCPRDGSATYSGRSRAEGGTLDSRASVTVTRRTMRDGSHARDGRRPFGTLRIHLNSFESPYPARDGRHTRGGALQFCGVRLEAA